MQVQQKFASYKIVLTLKKFSTLLLLAFLCRIFLSENAALSVALLFLYPVFKVHKTGLKPVVENSGIEPLTSCVQSRRSPS